MQTPFVATPKNIREQTHLSENEFEIISSMVAIWTHP